MRNYQELAARERIAGLGDKNSFREVLPPPARVMSPYLGLLNQPVSFDDGIVIGAATMNKASIYIGAQQGKFVGGSVGEVHSAKLTGLLKAGARDDIPVVLLLETGGVRLHEGSAGEIGMAEAIRAVFKCRLAGVPTVAVIGGEVGAFGGMGILAACWEHAIMTEHGRWGISGPIVIEKWMGVEEYDSQDRALVWRTSGGKTRYTLGDARSLVNDEMEAMRGAIGKLLGTSKRISLRTLKNRQSQLMSRLKRFGKCTDASQIWKKEGLKDLHGANLASASEFVKSLKSSRKAITQ